MVKLKENKLADFLRKNRTEAFEYDEKREKELIRKAEYAEGERIGLEKGEGIGEERVFGVYKLFREKNTETQIAEKMGMDVREVRRILARLNQ